VAAENRGADHPLIGKMLPEVSRYSFFQAVHLLQACYPEAARVGTQGPPEREVIRFKCALALTFAASDIVDLRESPRADGEGPRFDMTTAFLGIYGAGSPLPTFYTEELNDPEAEDGLVHEFIDLFHHRSISLFYRTWEKYRFSIQFRSRGADRISSRLMAMIGVSPDLLPPQPKVPPVRYLAYLGLLTQLPRSASALRGILEDYFRDVPVVIEQCAGRYLDIPADRQTRLGGANSDLGSTTTLGDRVFDRGASFRVRLGDMGFETFLSFLPPGGNTAQLREIVDLFNTDALDYEIKLWLKHEEIPPLRLSSDSALLGWATWVGRRPERNQNVSYLMKGRSHGQR